MQRNEGGLDDSMMAATKQGTDTDPASNTSVDPDLSNRSGASGISKFKKITFKDAVNQVMEDMAENKQSARQVLSTKLPGIRNKATVHSDREMVERAEISGILFPWMKSYRLWWSVTVGATILTAFFCPYTIAFEPQMGIFTTGAAVIEFILIGIFVLDIFVKFNQSYHVDEVLVYERKEIAKHYCKRFFWVDAVGVFPFYSVALAIAGERGEDSNKALLLSMFRLLQLVRLYRMRKFFDHLQYNAHVSLMYFTLLRNGKSRQGERTHEGGCFIRSEPSPYFRFSRNLSALHRQVWSFSSQPTLQPVHYTGSLAWKGSMTTRGWDRSYQSSPELSGTLFLCTGLLSRSARWDMVSRK